MQTRIKNSEKTGFENIYLLAKEQDIDKLTSYLRTHYACINEVDGSGLYTPAGKLAAEGDFKSALFLAEHFKASITSIAFGAGVSKNRTFCDMLRLKWNAPLTLLAFGAAVAKDVEYAEELRIDFNKNNNAIMRLMFAASLVFGAAIAGDKVYLKKLMSLYPKFLLNHNLGKGFGMGGHIELALEWEKNNKVNLSSTAYGAACAGFIEIAEYFRCRDNMNATTIASYAAQGGYNKYVDYLCEEYAANVDDIVESAAEGGHFYDVLFLLESYNASLLRAYKGSCKGGQASLTLYLMMLLANNHTMAEDHAANNAPLMVEFLYKQVNADIKHIAAGFMKSDLFTTEDKALHTLSIFKDDDFRYELCKSLAEENLVTYDVYDLNNRAAYLSFSSREYGIKFEQALALESFSARIWLLHALAGIKPAINA